MSALTHVYCIGDDEPVKIAERFDVFCERVVSIHVEGVSPLVQATVSSTGQPCAFGINTIAFVAPAPEEDE